MTENHRQTFRLSCLSSAIQLVVPPTCELLARLRSAATWDEASIHLAERDFPRVHIRCHQAGDFNVHCFENEQSLGRFLVTGLEFSPSSNRIEVIFDIGQSEFEELQRVIDIISGKSSLMIDAALSPGETDSPQAPCFISWALAHPLRQDVNRQA